MDNDNLLFSKVVRYRISTIYIEIKEAVTSKIKKIHEEKEEEEEEEEEEENEMIAGLIVARVSPFLFPTD